MKRLGSTRAAALLGITGGAAVLAAILRWVQLSNDIKSNGAVLPGRYLYLVIAVLSVAVLAALAVLIRPLRRQTRWEEIFSGGKLPNILHIASAVCFVIGGVMLYYASLPKTEDEALALTQLQKTMNLLIPLLGVVCAVTLVAFARKCLRHEKPFAGVNGSGKHNNWSMSTNTGYNLLEPGDDPATSAQFMLILTAVIKAVDEYADLLRISVASAGNDHRLGANEAPPAIISMFLGDELSAIVNAFEEEKEYCASEKHDLEIGVSVLPKFPKDNTDRNRTSPFAFTGNKFEFRSLGSSESIAEANVVINTIVAQSLKEFADELENAESFRETLHNLIVSNLRKHNRIIFNGNGYAPEWVEEAARRGLPNYVSTVDALPHMLDEKNIKLFTTFGVFTEAEIRSRYEIKLENYAKVLNIEAETCLMMAEKEILPACMKFAGATAKAVNAMKTAGVEPYAEAHVLADVAERNAKLYKALEGLRGAVKATCHGDALECAKYEHNVIIPAMAAVREQADELETLVGKEYWPFPTYDDLLFNV